MTNTRRFQLDYDVDAVGPSGVARVELYRTIDAGRSWQLAHTDPDRQSPLDVEVEQEGVYGFRIVIVANSGLASRKPAAGEQADLWVGVDLTPPEGRIESASFGKGADAGSLTIRWTARDALLADRPITLQISRTSAGPWQTIAAGLPNTGSYSWRPGTRAPAEAYLRLQIRDAAGNVRSDQLAQPLRLEGLQPRGRIRGFRPLR